MDYANLNAEYESLHSFTKQSLSTLSNLSLFFSNAYKSGENLLHSSKKATDVVLNRLVRSDSRSTISKQLISLYKNHNDYMEKFKATLSKIDKDLVEPISLFNKHLSEKFSSSLGEFKSVVQSVNESKLKLDKAKSKYFEASRQAQDQEKLFLKACDSNDQAATHIANETLVRNKLLAENLCLDYKEEIQRVNKNYEKNEKRYFPVISDIRLTEESRLFFIQSHVEKYVQIIQEFNDNTREYLTSVSSSLSNVDTEQDMKSFDLKFQHRIDDFSNERTNLTQQKFRIPREEFINYDIFKRNVESLMSLNNALYKNKPIALPPSDSHESIISTTSTFLANTFTNRTQQALDDKIIREFLSRIYDSEEIAFHELKSIYDRLTDNLDFSKFMIDSILQTEKRSLLIRFKNEVNFCHYGNMLNMISENINKSDELFEMHFAIIFIAGRSRVVLDSQEKYYMSAFLSKKNKHFNDKKFWKRLMDLKILRKIEDSKRMVIKQYEKIKVERDKIETSQKQGSWQTTSLLLNLGSRVKSMISHNYQKVELDEEHRILLDKAIHNDAASVLKEFIPSFAVFNLDLSDATELIMEYSEDYGFSKERLSFYITLLNSNSFTLKNKIPKNFLHGKFQRDDSSNSHLYNPPETRNSKELKEGRSESSERIQIHNSLRYEQNEYLRSSDIKISSILLSFNYLKLPEIFNVWITSKSYYKKFEKDFFDRALEENFNQIQRIEIWSSVLSLTNLRKKFLYSEILKELETNKSEWRETIDLDVQRTYFKTDTENKRKAISNMLNALSYSNPLVTYCQGMNYIASFLLELAGGNEEQAFFLILGLFTKTKFGEIFLDDLARLKIYFYMFERLLYLLMPDLYHYLRLNSIHVSFYGAPWFITLFTNSISNSFSSSENSKIITKIWDDFLIVTNLT